MNESILKALMRLFAIIANADLSEVSERERKVVRTYLSVMLNKKHVEIYLKNFDDYVKIYHHVKKNDSRKFKKQTSLNSVKVLKICSEINEQLHQKEKIVVLIRLLEFINENEIITEKEIDFVKTVSDIFNIPENEFDSLFNLTINKTEKIDSATTGILTINNEKHDKKHKHIFSENILGTIFILHIETTNTFVLKYVGNDSLFLNSQNITPYRFYIFDHGSVIKNPKIKPLYYSDISGKFIHSSDSAKVILKAQDIEFYYKNSKNGIQKFSFEEQSGRMIGIMGGSGVGKSTLLNVFNGNFPLHGGKITINGYDLHKEKDKLTGVIGFVPQDNLLIEELTVYQNLYYNAKLCFSDFSEQEIQYSVNKILNDLDLTITKDLAVGSPVNKYISGGQRKRLNIALELMREPSILIVDEPTSGLSSMDSEMVINLLKEQALKGKLVIVNIHQPSSDIYKLFDSLLMMDTGGYPVYYGNPVDAISYFKEAANYVNPEENSCSVCGNTEAEQPLQILESKIVDEFGKYTKDRKVTPKEWYLKYKKEIEAKINFTPKSSVTSKLPDNFFKIPSKFKQFLIFTSRNIKTKLISKQYLLITFLEAPILAVILGYFTKYISGTEADPNAYIFAENVNLIAYLFMAVTVSLFFGMTLSAEEIIRDRKILNREKFLHLSRFSYLNSKIIVLFIISAVQMFTFIIVGNWILGIQGMTLSYWLILFSASAFANILGLNISAAFNSVVTIYITIPFILVPQLLFSGVIVDFTKLHKKFTSYELVPVIGDLMTSRWAYEALAVEQFKGNKFEKYYFDVDKEKSNNNFNLSYLIHELEKYTGVCVENISKKKNNVQTIKYFEIIKNEIIELNKTTTNKFNNIENLKINKFNNEVNEELKKYYQKLKKEFNSNQYKINLKSDSVSHFLIKKLGSVEEVYRLKMQNNNKKLSEILRNNGEFDAIKEENNRLIQIIDPIFKNPKKTNGRAHFYAPYKKIGNFKIDTFWFNFIFIWFTSFVIYLALIFNLFRKFLNLFEMK